MSDRAMRAPRFFEVARFFRDLITFRVNSLISME